MTDVTATVAKISVTTETATAVVSATPAKIEVTAENRGVAVTSVPAVVEVAAIGAQGAPGPTEVFVQDAQPAAPQGPAMWVQTGLGTGADFDLKFWRA